MELTQSETNHFLGRWILVYSKLRTQGIQATSPKSVVQIEKELQCQKDRSIFSSPTVITYGANVLANGKIIFGVSLHKQPNFD